MGDVVRRVALPEWVDAARQAHAEGFTWFDLLTCIDEIGRDEAFRLVARLERAPSDAARLECLVPRDAATVATLGEVFAGATWREREVTASFGVTFVGGDPRPLLGRPDAVGHPLRKDAVLAARAVTPWPGGRDPGQSGTAGRRRAAAPGVPDPAVWGERDGDPASADEVAASASGGRRRR